MKLQIESSVHDPEDPVGGLLFNVLAMVAEFEVDLIRARTREGMAVAKARGRLKGRKPKLSPAQEELLVKTHQAGEHISAEIAASFGISRATVFRVLQRAGEGPTPG